MNKKISIIVIMIGILLLFAGCIKKQPETIDNDNNSNNIVENNVIEEETISLSTLDIAQYDIYGDDQGNPCISIEAVYTNRNPNKVSGSEEFKIEVFQNQSQLEEDTLEESDDKSREKIMTNDHSLFIRVFKLLNLDDNIEIDFMRTDGDIVFTYSIPTPSAGEVIVQDIKHLLPE